MIFVFTCPNLRADKQNRANFSKTSLQNRKNRLDFITCK